MLETNLQRIDHPFVGSHLYDHHGGSVVVQVPNSVATEFQLQYNTTFAARAKADYEQEHGGYLSSSIAGTFAVARTPASINHGNYSPNQQNQAGQLMFQTGTASFVPGTPNVSAVTLLASLTQSQSFGGVRLNSSDYRDYPLINSNFFGSAQDKAAIIYAYKAIRKLARSAAMKSVVVKELFPGPSVPDDDESIYKVIQSSPIAYYHPMGTTGLGRVLDQHFRVKGLQGIRVVDAGAFPAGTSCHPHATVYGFARAAARSTLR